MQQAGILETAKATNPLKDLQKYGQSVWLDYIRRNLITSGELKRLIEEDGLRGITSNPAIFEKAITGSTDYSDILSSLQSQSDLDAKARYEQLAIRDIQDAADVLRPVYEQKAEGWIREPRGLALSGARYAGHDGRSASAMESGGAGECDDQSARNRRGCSRLSAAHQ